MFLKIYNKNEPYLIFLIPLTAIFLWITGFTNCNLDTFLTEHSIKMPLYNLIDKYVNFNCYISLSIALILAVFQSFYLSYINREFIFITQRTYLHSFIFLLIVSSNSITKFATPAIFANFFILLSINWLFNSYKKVEANTYIFNSGLFLAIATMFYLDAFILLPLFIFIYFLLHNPKIKEILVFLIGFITPLFITASILFINDNLFYYVNSVWIYLTNTNYNLNNIYNYIFYGWLLFLLIIALLKYSNYSGTKKISSRKFLSVFIYIIIYNTALYFTLPFLNLEILIVTAAPIAFVLTDYFVNKKNNFIHELIFGILIIMFVILQLNT